MVTVPWITEHAAATAVREYLSPGPDRWLWLLPRSRFHPESTLWWNVPSNDQIAYQFGKLFFDIWPDDPTTLHCGLHVERGYEEPDATRDRRKLMKPTWTWHPLLRDLDSLRIRHALDALQRANLQPIVYLRADMEAPHDSGSPFEVLFFDLSDGRLSYREEKSTINTTPMISAWTDLRDLADLKNRITTHPRLGWYWLNVFLGCSFATGAHENDPSAWDAQLLADRALTVWQPWLR